jgi:HD-GYP domain-containing protein (c-di-GMP phosphodiesterase class II)
MPNSTVAVDTHRLKIGMYVAELDRPWLESPFLFQGFRIETDDDLVSLREHCEYVYVDTHKGLMPDPADAAKTLQTRGINAEIKFDPPRSPVYEDAHPVETEWPEAEQACENLDSAIKELLDALRAGGEIEIERLDDAVEPVIDSVVRNPDAMMWLSKMRCKGEYNYRHSLRSCVLAVNFGRHLGLAKELLETLAMGGLLLDVGKTRIPMPILEKPGELSEQELALVRLHVEFGVELLQSQDNVDQRVIAMVRCHHERHDGSGYPDGFADDSIPPFGKIAGIVDCFDAMTSVRGYGQVLSTHSALNQLNKERGLTFDAALVEQFIQALGIYPAGSLVELSDGSVGAVVEQNRRRRLKPRILLILDCDKTPLGEPQVIDLMNDNETHGQGALHIAGSLRSGKYGIDPDDYFL